LVWSPLLITLGLAVESRRFGSPLGCLRAAEGGNNGVNETCG
jgi:hypothetical protein